MIALLSPLNDSATEDSAIAERAFQAALNVGCTFPVGGHAVTGVSDMRFIAMIGSPDGSDSAQMEMSGSRAEATELGRAAADAILNSNVGRALRASP